MFSHFFIERPIFASVLSIVITLTGFVALYTLPVAQYPQITPPSIMVMCNYPGANAQVVADAVKQAGVTTRKRNPDILQVIAIYSPSGRYDQLYLSNFCTIHVRDEISRVEGVGDCQQFGQQDYSMRIWLDPERLAALNMTAY